MNAIPPGPNRPNFPMGPGSDGPMDALGGMESHHMSGSLGSGDMDSISKVSIVYSVILICILFHTELLLRL